MHPNLRPIVIEPNTPAAYRLAGNSAEWSLETAEGRGDLLLNMMLLIANTALAKGVLNYAETSDNYFPILGGSDRHAFDHWFHQAFARILEITE